MPANAIEIFVRPRDHHHGIPSNDAVEAFLKVKIARVGALIFRMNAVQVGRVHDVNVNTRLLGCVEGGMQKAFGFLRAETLLNRSNGVLPFLG